VVERNNMNIQTHQQKIRIDFDKKKTNGKSNHPKFTRYPTKQDNPTRIHMRKNLENIFHESYTSTQRQYENYERKEDTNI